MASHLTRYFRGAPSGCRALSAAAAPPPTPAPPPMRSKAWFGKFDKDGFIHRSWMKNQGLPNDAFDGRPVIGIANTWSELTPCNAHFREIAERVKRGVWEAGGVPVEFPVLSTGETLMRPTAMLYRNLMAMDAEEMIRANPIDGVVLLAGCDKTTPGLLMGAASTGVPTILVSGGPMLNGKYKGKDIGSGTDVWKFSEAVRAGTMTAKDFFDAESCSASARDSRAPCGAPVRVKNRQPRSLLPLALTCSPSRALKCRARTGTA